MGSFICSKCGRAKDIEEAIFLDLCEDCHIDEDLDRRRPALYEKLGIQIRIASPLTDEQILRHFIEKRST